MAQPLLGMLPDQQAPGSAAPSSARFSAASGSARGSAAPSSARGSAAVGSARFSAAPGSALGPGTPASSSRRRCCLTALWRRCLGRPVEDAAGGGERGELRPASMIDPRSLVSDTDRLLAGVSRLIYRHISDRETCAASSPASRQDRKSTKPPGGKCSGSLRQGCSPLTSADFSEELFTEPVRCRRCRCRCCRCFCFLCIRTPNLVDEIFRLLKNISALSEFKKDIVVLAVIYIERLLARHAALHLSTCNWRPILIACLHLASKTWEDVHAWNTEFVAYLQWALGICYPVRSLHRLEMHVFTGLEYHMEVTAEVYAAYYFALMEADGAGTPPAWTGDASELPRSNSLSCIEDLASSTLTVTERLRPTEVDCPPSPSSASSCAREVQSRVQDSLASLATCATSTTATPGPLMRRTVSVACTQADAFATFCGGEAPEDLWQLRPQLMPRLDASHPLLGYFRHAPRAELPSPYMQGRSRSSQNVQAVQHLRARPRLHTHHHQQFGSGSSLAEQSTRRKR